MASIFSQEALRSRRIPGDLAGPIKLLTPPLKATVFVGFALVASGIAWAVLARIPITVNAIGVLLPVSTINTIPSRVEGKANWTFNQESKRWHTTAFQFARSPENFDANQIVELAESILGDTVETSLVEGKNSESNSAEFAFKQNDILGAKLPEGKLMLWVKSNSIEQRLTVGLMKWKSQQNSIEKKLSNLSVELTNLNNELLLRHEMFLKMKQAGTEVFSGEVLLNEQANLDNLEAEILNVKSQKLTLQQELTNSLLDFKNILSSVIDAEMIFADQDLFLYQVIPNDSEEVMSGEIVLKVSSDLVRSPGLVPVFIDNNDKASVAPGMSALVTPVGFNRTEYGGINGTVSSVAPIPSTLEGMEARIGVKSLAQSIQATMSTPTLVVLNLEKSSDQNVVNSGGYQWSTSTSLPFEPREGSKINAEITTGYVSPISLVLPSLHKFFGFSPPDPIQLQQSKGVAQQ